MQTNLTLKYVLVMTFIGVVLGYYLYSSGVDFLAAAGIWLFVVLGFGTYLYFRIFRPRTTNEEPPDERNDD